MDAAPVIASAHVSFAPRGAAVIEKGAGLVRGEYGHLPVMPANVAFWVSLSPVLLTVAILWLSSH